MSDTLTNVPLTAGEWIDLYAETGIAVGTPISVSNIGDADAYLAVQGSEPEKEHDAYDIIRRDYNFPFENNSDDPGAWAFSPNVAGLVNVKIVSSTGFTPKIPLSESYGQTGDFLLEVAKGNIPGHSLVPIIMRNPDTSAAFVDIWAGVGNMTYPTAGETWEIASDSDDDTDGGIGAHSVVVNSLDTNYDRQATPVIMDGQNPVALTNTHFRPGTSFVVDAGSNRTNVGKITIRVAGDGEERNIIPIAFANSQDGHFTVPAGHTAFGVQIVPFYPKDQSGNIRNKIYEPSFNVEYIGAEIPIYQNAIVLPIKAPFVLLEKTDITFQANSDNPNVELVQIADILIVENDDVNAEIKLVIR